MAGAFNNGQVLFVREGEDKRKRHNAKRETPKRVMIKQRKQMKWLKPKACILHEKAYIKRDDIHTTCMHQKIFLPLSQIEEKKKVMEGEISLRDFVLSREEQNEGERM
ncbi:unnamed protein product [Sphenostylis stenocarpa]|uniref:Uncharacterized protein n=1 Tax=Sphenostylis stenocarpa TaxID=92480 RepID=A0AA86SW12_9FABA|nr:unnamed protein product [Sphenostylis stenocarpa]